MLNLGGSGEVCYYCLIRAPVKRIANLILRLMYIDKSIFILDSFSSLSVQQVFQTKILSLF